MVYLERFVLPSAEEEYNIARSRLLQNGGYLDNGYPCMLFTNKELSELNFNPVTILYGGNGSGKSTLLNIICAKLSLARISAYNGAELLLPYAGRCKCYFGCDDEGNTLTIPPSSAMITSDDVFEYMLAARTVNEEIREDNERGRVDYARLKHGESIRFTGMEVYEDYKLQVMSRRKSLSRRKFLQNTVGREVRLESNGETALEFFASHIQNDTLCCLDEPENSLSPKLQLELRALLSDKQRCCGCQFIIATHSPFILSMEGARIYDLDSVPVDIKNWWELENTRAYFDFFEKNRRFFTDPLTFL